MQNNQAERFICSVRHLRNIMRAISHGSFSESIVEIKLSKPAWMSVYHLLSSELEKQRRTPCGLMSADLGPGMVITVFGIKITYDEY